MRERMPLVAALAACAIAAPALAAVEGRARLTPSTVHLGEPARYVGAVTFRRGSLARPRWLAPETSASLSWGPRRPRLARGAAGAPDTLWVEATIQAFELGRLSVPGLRVRDQATPSVVHRLPTLTLKVVPVLAAADSNADLRAVRGPLAAPWWERVPWRWVVLGLLALAALVVLVRWLLLRRPKPEAVIASQTDPATRALERLAALRALRLPEAGAFAEHAFVLTGILRRYLEVTAGTARPGHTTSELAARLAEGGLAADEVESLVALMRFWDRVKFARAGSDVREAHRAEAAVEAFVRQRATQPVQAAA